MDIDIDSYAALAVGDEDIHVELDEKDFSDPHLLVRTRLYYYSACTNFDIEWAIGIDR